MQDEIIINKAGTIAKCLKRVREEYDDSSENFLSNQTKQDAIILNLERAAQATIDMAAHIVRIKKLGAPKETKDLFLFLFEKKIISEDTQTKMRKIIGFRNIAVHEYQKLNVNIVISIIKSHLTDFEVFIKEILKN
ncbi:MAG: DUF86 domain-containing protein [Gammaproteobacteria bacterium]|nr:DUF86 domain-containing protein [Gammaproteobacteria bacterium]